MVVLVYIDDIVLAGNDAATCQQFKVYLCKCFNIKDLGPLKHFLRIKIAHGLEG